MRSYLLITFIIIPLLTFATIINIPEDYTTIQAGIDASIDADTVLVQPGTYLENINYNGKNITVASLFLTTQDTTYISQTVINRYLNFSVVRFINGETMDAVLTGFTITNGNAQDGGGIAINGSSPTIKYNVITGNTAANIGGGVFVTGNSSPVLFNNDICNNISESMSGAMSIMNSSATSHCIVEKCRIYGNTAVVNAGGLGILNSNVDIIDCTISGNTTDGDGGGIVVTGAEADIINCIISGNNTENGGGVALSGANSDIINCTISGNSAIYGGGISLSSSDVTIINSIVEGNAALQGNGIYFSQPGNVDIEFNDFFNGGYDFSGDIPTGLGDNTGFNIYGTACDEFFNIYEDPVFAGAGDHPFSLLGDSPCIDAGVQDTSGLNLPFFDIIGNERILDGRVDGFAYIDMGAYEFDPDPSSVEQYDIPVADLKLSNYPNPFNPTTTISFTLTTENTEKAEMVIYNLKGQKIISFDNTQFVTMSGVEGMQTVTWNGTDDNNQPVSSGIYFYRLKAENNEQIKKMILMK